MLISQNAAVVVVLVSVAAAATTTVAAVVGFSVSAEPSLDTDVTSAAAAISIPSSEVAANAAGVVVLMQL